MARSLLLILTFAIGCTRQQKEAPLIAMDTPTVVKQTPASTQSEPSYFVLDTVSGGTPTGTTEDHIVSVLSFMDSFDRAHLQSSQDTFGVFEQTVEGCEVIVLHDTSTGYFRIQGTRFGELGKYEFRIYLKGEHNALQLIAAVTNDVRYDRPMYQEGMQYASTLEEYEIYGQNRLVSVLNEHRIPKIRRVEELSVSVKEDDLRSFFKTYIGQVTKEDVEQVVNRRN